MRQLFTPSNSSYNSREGRTIKTLVHSGQKTYRKRLFHFVFWCNKDYPQMLWNHRVANNNDEKRQNSIQFWERKRQDVLELFYSNGLMIGFPGELQSTGVRVVKQATLLAQHARHRSATRRASSPILSRCFSS